MRIGFDIDGVGFNFADSCHRYLIEIGQGHLWKSGPTPVPFWDWYKDWGWTSAQFVEFCHAGVDAGFIFAGDVRPGYVESIMAVAQMGHEIIIATDRPFGATPEVSQKLTVEWLEQHGIEYDELHFTADKTTARADMFIEDKLENYDALVASGVNAFLLNRPWNQLEGGDARNRVDTMEEYTEAVRQVTEQGFADLTFA